MSAVRLILSADKPFYFSSKNEVTHVVDRLTDLAVDVGFGTRLRCRGELNPHSLGRRARGLDCQRSSGSQSGLARLATLIRVAHLLVIRNQSSLAPPPGLSQTSQPMRNTNDYRKRPAWQTGDESEKGP